jgi:biotin carboxyl carrier protein
MTRKNENPWLERVEEIISVLEGSTIGEIELTEGETEIIIRRSPDLVLTADAAVRDSQTEEGHSRRAAKADQSIPIVAPLTGVYYSAASPTSPPFASVGDVIHVGQVVALIEAMKVFNEVNAEAAGRVVAMTATNGTVVQKGDVLLRIEPVSKWALVVEETLFKRLRLFHHKASSP